MTVSTVRGGKYSVWSTHRRAGCWEQEKAKEGFLEAENSSKDCELEKMGRVFYPEGTCGC